MTTPLVVWIDEDAGERRRISAVLQSLPLSYRLSDTAAPDLVVMSGAAEDWPGRALSYPGPVAVCAPIAVPGCAELAGARVFLDPGAGAHPQVGAHAADVRATHAPVLIEATTSIGSGDTSLARALPEQLALVADLAGVPEVVSFTPSPGGYVLTGIVAGPPDLTAQLSAVHSPITRACTVNIVGVAERWHVSVDASPAARAATMTRYDAAGAFGTPLVYERPLRAWFRGVHASLTSGPGSAPQAMATALVQAADLLARHAAATHTARP